MTDEPKDPLAEKQQPTTEGQVEIDNELGEMAPEPENPYSKLKEQELRIKSSEGSNDALAEILRRKREQK